MSNIHNSKDYAQMLLRNVERLKNEKEAQQNKREELSKIFNTLNEIISDTISENGLTEFISLNRHKGQVEMSAIPYQSSPKFKLEVDYFKASCSDIELTFFNKDMFRGPQSNIELSIFVIPEKASIYQSIATGYANGIKDYSPSLNEQYAINYDKKNQQWMLNICDRGTNKFISPDEVLTTDSIMRIFYSAFASVLK
ncbi:TPA: hypothetical protein MYO02_005254 [Klebsiella variicola subsp. variicola]|nr:hypothetical protein [Klebsiella variicola subsp. variicola]